MMKKYNMRWMSSIKFINFFNAFTLYKFVVFLQGEQETIFLSCFPLSRSIDIYICVTSKDISIDILDKANHL